MNYFHSSRGVIFVLLPLALLCGCLPATQTNAKSALQTPQSQEPELPSTPPLQTTLVPEEQEEFRLGYAKLLIDSGREAEAEALLDKLRHNTKLAPEAYPLLAKIYEQRGMRIEALLAWEKALQFREGNQKLMGRVARAALVCKKYHQADEIFNQWLAHNQAGSELHIAALNNLGYSSLLQHHYDRAAHFFGQALASDPLNKRAKANLSLLERLKKEGPSAAIPLALNPETFLLPTDPIPLKKNNEGPTS